LLRGFDVYAEILDRRTEYEAAHALRIRLYNARRAIDDIPKAWDLLNIAMIEIELGNLASARQRVEVAQRAVTSTTRKATGLDTITEIVQADIHFHDGRHENANKGFQKALAGTEWMDLGIIAIEKLSNVALRTDDMRSAMVYSVLLLAAAQNTHDPAATHQSLRRLGDISLKTGDETTAMNLFQAALDGFELMGIRAFFSSTRQNLPNLN
jgi:predicted negative regulator of RcsB-dependent stress response